MAYSVHVAKVGGARATYRALRRELPAVSGLRHADAGFMVDLGGPLNRPPAVHAGQVAMLAWWESDDALEAFLSSPGLGGAFAKGWHARVEPLRVYNSWTSLPELPADEVDAGPDEPMIAVTIARTRYSQLPRFLSASKKAEILALESEAFVWGTALVRLPRTLATLTVWQSVAAMRDYALGRAGADHMNAIKEQRRKDFHLESAFIRLRPLSEHGTIDGLAPVASASSLTN